MRRLLSVVILCALGGYHPCSADFQLFGRYEFDGSYADSLGHFADLVPQGGSMAGGNYLFPDNQGLRLDTNLTSGDYRIEFDATFIDLDSWDKLIDFQNRTTDDGLYIDPSTNNFLTFYNYQVFSPTPLLANTPYTIGLERVGGVMTASINGVTAFSLLDVNAWTVSSFDRLYFFVDDSVITQEGVSGFVSEIRLFTPASVPEPSLLGLVLLSVPLARRFRTTKPG